MMKVENCIVNETNFNIIWFWSLILWKIILSVLGKLFELSISKILQFMLILLTTFESNNSHLFFLFLQF